MDVNEVETRYRVCTMCPHRCGVNRFERTGLCGEGAQLKLAWAGLHFGEEPVLTCKGGSGTVFVTGCNLQCAFCQNYQVSQEGMGRIVSEAEFVEIVLRLQAAGAENLNIVTGTHQAFLLKQYIAAARKNGCTLPVVWNTSSYETPETVRALAGTVDIWLADIKTFDVHTACNVFNAPDYVEMAQEAILAMCEQSPLRFETAEKDLNGSGNKAQKLLSGVIVRHLALPESLPDSFRVLQWFAQQVKKNALLSLMTQYTPVKNNKKFDKITAFENRLLESHEDEALRKFLTELDIDDGFYQELEPDYSWLPDFSRVQTFSSKLSKPIWHYANGFV